MAAFNELFNELLDDLEPRTQRKRNRASSDRGLPPDDELRNLARTYLMRQKELWPHHAKAGHFPEATDSILSEMVNGYKERHRSGQIGAKKVREQLSMSANSIGVFYGRYSCDNSSPTSILDQLYNALGKAQGESRFIPWEFVFADYSVSGLDASRQGYGNCKTLTRECGSEFDTIYIDDFTRASRDSLEWWRLASLCKSSGKRMIGASDGFDLASPDWDIKVTIYGLISRLFISGLREKVLRGMKGAARRGTVLGKLPIGFTRKPVKDESGTIVRRPNGKPLYQPAIDPESRSTVKMLFMLFEKRKWSAHKIAKVFNQKEIDNTTTWTETGVKKMLANPAYLGVFFWNRTRREYDYETEKWVKKANPSSEWIKYIDTSLQIIAPRQWKEARRRLRKKKKGGNKSPSRNQKSATTLLSGTLHCGYCGKELTLCRSAGKYKNMFCVNGRIGVHGCQLSTTKSTRIIEECVLDFLRDKLLTESAIQGLVEKANDHLQKMAEKPKVDTHPVQSKINKTRKQVDRLVQRVSKLDVDEDPLREGYERNILKLQKELDELRDQLHVMEQDNSTPPPPLDTGKVECYIADMRGLLNLEIPEAAEAIRQLTGPIEIRQKKIEGKRGARWIATLTPNLSGLMRFVSQQKGYPDSITLEYLCHANWITPTEIHIPIEKIPAYEELAPKFKELHDNGASIHEIASKHKFGWHVALEVLNFTHTGVRPQWYINPDSVRFAGWDYYMEIAPIIAELRDQAGMDWPVVVEEVQQRTGHQISTVTALRAYEYAHRRMIRQTAGIGTEFKPRLDQGKFDHFKKLYSEGITNGAELARRLEISRNTANRWKKVLRTE